MKINLRSQLGFSLVQVMIAAGLMGGLALMIAKLGDNQNKISKSAKVASDTSEIYNRIHRYMLDDVTCSSSLGNHAVNEGGEFNISEIKKGASILLTSNPPNNKLGQVIVKSMKVKRRSGVQKNTVDLVVTLEKVSKGASYGSESINRSFELNASFDANQKITKCYSHLDAAVTTSRGRLA